MIFSFLLNKRGKLVIHHMFPYSTIPINFPFQLENDFLYITILLLVVYIQYMKHVKAYVYQLNEINWKRPEYFIMLQYQCSEEKIKRILFDWEKLIGQLGIFL